jgi:TonB family protein
VNPKKAFRKLKYLGVAIMAMPCSVSSDGAEIKVVTPKELMAMFDKKMVPVYPYEARRSRMTGSGLFRMYIDPDGNVRTVAVMKSTGSKILDLAAAGGLYHCHAKPGRRREVDMPVTFKMF